MEAVEVLERWEKVIIEAVELLSPEQIRDLKEQFFFLVGFPPLPAEEQRRLQLFLEYLVLEMEVKKGYTPLDLLLRSAGVPTTVIVDGERFHRSYLALAQVRQIKRDTLLLEIFPSSERIRVKPLACEGFSTDLYLITRIIPFERENFIPSTTEILEPRHRSAYLNFLKTQPRSMQPREVWLATLFWNHLVRQFPAAKAQDLLYWFRERLNDRKLLYAQAQ